MITHKKTCIVILLICITSILRFLYDSHVLFITPGSTIELAGPLTSNVGHRTKDTTAKPSVVHAPDGQMTSLLRREDHHVVPNIVHFVWFGEHEPLKFHQMLSVKSAYKHIKPDIIYVHCDHEPEGHWWRHIKKAVKTLKVKFRNPPREIFGNEVILPEHKSDIARIEILMEYGGIYMDFDVIALKSFDDLRFYNMTMGLEYFGSPGRLNNGVIVATKQARFLKLWYETYHDFTKREWDYHDSIVPYEMQFQFPELIHVEEKTINFPGGKELELIYDKVYDWHGNYAVHLWYRLHEFEHNPTDIKTMDTTYGQIARLVYYGNSTLINK